MPYLFAHERPDYTDFAAGPVFYSLPGRPAFPVRLTTEIFQRCAAYLQRQGNHGRYTVYDPCCGSAYLLAILAYLHWPVISQVIGSDVDPGVMALAERNLSLLTFDGIEKRIAQLEELHHQYGKISHEQALASMERLRRQLQANRRAHAIESRLFVANALDGANLQPMLAPGSVDIVMTDIPYGQRSVWHETNAEAAPGWQILEALRQMIAPVSIIAITTDKGQKIAHAAYQRVEQFQIGKRRTLFFSLRPERSP